MDNIEIIAHAFNAIIWFIVVFFSVLRWIRNNLNSSERLMFGMSGLAASIFGVIEFLVAVGATEVAISHRLLQMVEPFVASLFLTFIILFRNESQKHI